MRFCYQYRTSKNEVRHGEIRAVDREAAFVALKARGIHPSRVDEASGFFNKLLGRGKRWLAICVLSLALVAMVVSALRWRGEARELAVTGAAELQPLPRHHIRAIAAPGFDPSTVFERVHEKYLARYAMRGVEPRTHAISDELQKDFAEGLGQPVEVCPDDPPEVVELKRIVEGMKEDARKYSDMPNGIARFCEWIEERQAMERDYRDRFVQRMRRGELTKDEVNGVFRAMGLEEIE